MKVGLTPRIWHRDVPTRNRDRFAWISQSRTRNHLVHQAGQNLRSSTKTSAIWGQGAALNRGSPARVKGLNPPLTQNGSVPLLISVYEVILPIDMAGPKACSGAKNLLACTSSPKYIGISSAQTSPDWGLRVIANKHAAWFSWSSTKSSTALSDIPDLGKIEHEHAHPESSIFGSENGKGIRLESDLSDNAEELPSTFHCPQ